MRTEQWQLLLGQANKSFIIRPKESYLQLLSHVSSRGSRHFNPSFWEKCTRCQHKDQVEESMERIRCHVSQAAKYCQSVLMEYNHQWEQRERAERKQSKWTRTIKNARKIIDDIQKSRNRKIISPWWCSYVISKTTNRDVLTTRVFRFLPLAQEIYEEITTVPPVQ